MFVVISAVLPLFRLISVVLLYKVYAYYSCIALWGSHFKLIISKSYKQWIRNQLCSFSIYSQSTPLSHSDITFSCHFTGNIFLLGKSNCPYTYSRTSLYDKYDSIPHHPFMIGNFWLDTVVLIWRESLNHYHVFARYYVLMCFCKNE